MNLYPINLSVSKRGCIIVGGGDVAARKIGPLLTCGAQVVVISPEAVPAIQKLAEYGDIEYRKRVFREGDLQGAYLVFAATNDREVQALVAAEADRTGVLINSVDNPRECNFQVPARVRRGNFLLTISTGGSSPALAAKLRKRLEKEYGPEYEQYVDFLSRIRAKIVDDGNTTASHKILFERLLQLNILECIEKKDWSTLRRELVSVLPAELDARELIESIISAGELPLSPGGDDRDSDENEG